MTTLAAAPKESCIDSVTVSEDSLTIELTDGRSISAPIVWYPGLLHGTAAERSHYELTGDGAGVHWPDLDEDISAENLIRGCPSGESQQSFARWLETRRSAAA